MEHNEAPGRSDLPQPAHSTLRVMQGDEFYRYVVISPVRDEGKHIEATILSMVRQTIRPNEWIIVDDGSTDNTYDIVEKYAGQHDWIHLVLRVNRGFRKAGGGVIEAFYDGYNRIRTPDWNFVVKMDGDLDFDENYFRNCLERFRTCDRLGIGGGVIYNLIDGEHVYEPTPRFHVRGATKIYRRRCWEDIGGLLVAPGWDTLDEVKANMLQWETESFLELKVVHLRPTGEADGSWKNWVKNGVGSYISGYHGAYMAAKCIIKIFQKPYFVGGAGLLYGYLKASFTGVSRVDDPELIKYIRQQQLNRLLFRKSIWK